MASLTQWIEQTLLDTEGQGRLACCSPWGRKESDTTEWQSNNKYHTFIFYLKCVFLKKICARVVKNKKSHIQLPTLFLENMG